ncbi:MAG: hypothetical protein GY838_04325 [bacterium]|nr:hypothetical protein [bacterium]
MGKWKTRVLPGAAVVLICGIAGWVLFLQLATDVENLPSAEVRQEFEGVRAGLAARPPMLVADAAGDVVRNPAATDDPSARPRWVKARVFDAGAARLVRVALPFWWVRLKSPVFEYALRQAGEDPARLGVTVADLQRHGVGLIIDDTQANDDLLLIWTE